MYRHNKEAHDQAHKCYRLKVQLRMLKNVESVLCESKISPQPKQVNLLTKQELTTDKNTCTLGSTLGNIAYIFIKPKVEFPNNKTPGEGG